MPRKKTKPSERVIPVMSKDIEILLDKWDRMTVRESSFCRTWSIAGELAMMLGVFVGRDMTKTEEL